CTIRKDEFKFNDDLGRNPILCPFQACNNPTLIAKNYYYHGYLAPQICLCPDNPFDTCYCPIDFPAHYHDDGEYRCDSCLMKKTCACNNHDAFSEANRKEDGTFGYTRSYCRVCRPWAWGDVRRDEYEHWVRTCDCYYYDTELGTEPPLGASCEVAIDLWRGYGHFWDLYDIEPVDFSFPAYMPKTCECNPFVVPLMEESNEICSYCRQVRSCFCSAFVTAFGIPFPVNCQFCRPDLHYHIPYQSDNDDDNDDSNDSDSSSSDSDSDSDSDDSGYHSTDSTDDDSLHSQDTDDFFYGTSNNALSAELDNAVYEALNGTYTASIVRSPSPWSDTWIANGFQHPLSLDPACVFSRPASPMQQPYVPFSEFL